MSGACPNLEQVFVELAEGRGPALEHARSCSRCSRLLEEHHQLEQDLFRLADPFPPANFVQQVMAKVASAPIPMQREVWAGLGIVAAALLLGITSLIISGNVGLFGVATASTLVDAKVLLFGLGDGLAAAWKTAALPLCAMLFGILLFGLFGLKQLVGGFSFAEAKVRATR